MDEHLAHISEDEFYSEEDKKDKEKDKDGKPKTKEQVKTEETSVKEPLKDEESVPAEDSDHLADDPSGKLKLIIMIISKLI